MGARAVEAMHACGVGNKHRIGAADEQPALDDADDPPDALVQMRRIGNAPEVAIENVIAVVGDERLACRRHAHMRRCAKHFERLAGRFQAERNNLDRNGGVRAEPVHKLAAVDDDGEAVACRGHDLLAQQSSAQSLDQIERAALHFVGAVDREIDLSMLAERRQWNISCRRLRGRNLGCRNTNKTQPLPLPPGECFDCESRRRAAAKPDDHVVLDQLHRGFGGGALKRVAIRLRG